MDIVYPALVRHVLRTTGECVRMHGVPVCEVGWDRRVCT
jgi:hypothetical protein